MALILIIFYIIASTIYTVLRSGTEVLITYKLLSNY